MDIPKYIYVHDRIVCNSSDLGCSFVGNEIPLVCRGGTMFSLQLRGAASGTNEPY